VGFGNGFGARVGHSRATGFGEEADGMSLGQGLQHTGDLLAGSMLVQLAESQLVDNDGWMGFLEETAGGTDVLDDEMAKGKDDVKVIIGKRLPVGAVTERDGDEVEGGSQVKHRERRRMRGLGLAFS
jgi:hypothetical protein